MLKHHISWSKFLTGTMGSPVPFTEKRVPVNWSLSPMSEYFPWTHSLNRVGKWYHREGVWVGLDTISTPVTLHFLYELSGDLYQLTVMSTQHSGQYNMGANFKEIKTLIKSFTDHSLLPLCVGYEWAGSLLESRYKS